MQKNSVRLLDHIIEYCLYGLLFFIPISNAAVEIFASMALLSFIAKKVIEPDFNFLKTRYYIFLGFFILFNIFSLLNSGVYFQKSLRALFFKWGEYIAIMLIISDAFNEKRVNKGTVIFILSGLLVGIDGFVQKVYGIEFLRQRAIISVQNGIFAITGPFHHYNNFGAYLSFMLVFIVALSLVAQEIQLVRIFRIPVMALLSFCLLFTFSRGSWLGFGAGILLMLFISPRKKVLISLIVIFLAMLLFMTPLRERLFFIFQPGGDSERFAIWKGAWLMIKRHPFLGNGLGTFMDYIHLYAPQVGAQYAHNCYLQIWAETGIFSLVSFLGFVGVLLWESIVNLKKGESYLLLGLICGTFAFLVHSFFDNHLYSLKLAVLLWTSLGFLSVLSRATYSENLSQFLDITK